MLFMITQTHTPESCPIDAGGSKVLTDSNAAGVKVRAMYGAYSAPTIYYVLEADSVDGVQKFLEPGFKRCTATVTPVYDQPYPPA
ncbi:MAG: hypothetical protein Q8P22_11405 [Chloroflexota bacterium]|nr:hypothetical protein [Chloroflexota bacterium]